jgi:hypothetical protein
MASLDDYLNLVPSANRNKPNFIATLTVILQPFIDEINTTATMTNLFDIDLAIGDQLDKIGLWVGIGRIINVPGYGTTMLDDAHYRILLYARIARNSWKGNIPDAYAIFNTVFQGLFTVFIIDNGDMSMYEGIFGSPDALTLALMKGGYLDFRPAGVLINYVNGDIPFFGFDYNNSFIAGFDSGKWVTFL